MFGPRARPIAGRRVLITGAARGIGAALAERLYDRGAHVALLGLEPERLSEVARRCGDAPWAICDVTRGEQVDAGVEHAVRALGGLDVAVANAGVAAQLPLIGGDPELFVGSLMVNTVGSYHTMRAAGPHIAHPGGYAVVVSSLAAAVHLPLLGAYNASKAAAEALGNTLRIELRPAGARVGVAYFAQLDTDMTTRGFGTKAAARLLAGPAARFHRVAPMSLAVDALERGIARRRRRIVAPAWVAAVLPIRMVAQPVVDRVMRRGLKAALHLAREEHAGLTTPQPEDHEA